MLELRVEVYPRCWRFLANFAEEKENREELLRVADEVFNNQSVMTGPSAFWIKETECFTTYMRSAAVAPNGRYKTLSNRFARNWCSWGDQPVTRATPSQVLQQKKRRNTSKSRIACVTLVRKALYFWESPYDSTPL